MNENARLLIVFMVVAAYLWLMYASLRRAWDAEQEHKAREAAWLAAHPAQAPTLRQQSRERIVGLVYLLIGGAAALALHLNGLQAAALLALPVLAYRGWKQYRRKHDAANAERFGAYVPTFKDRR